MIFAAMAQRQGSRDALVSRHQGLRYSYAELHAAARQLASALLNQGLEKAIASASGATTMPSGC